MPFRLEPARDRTLFRLVKQTDPVRWAKGRTLYGAGEPARDVLLVREGLVRLVLPGMERDRPDRTVAVAVPWEFFGDEALSQGHRRYGAVAGSACVAYVLPAARVLAGLKSAKSSLSAYLQGVERELYRLRHAQGGSGGPDTGQRLADVLLELAVRCGEPVGRGMRLSERLTHQVLADLAGAHRATVTTLLNDWLYRGVLAGAAGGRLVVQRPTELRVLAGYDPPGVSRWARPSRVDPERAQS